jgi:oligopeptide transport system ATP-binding protein
MGLGYDEPSMTIAEPTSTHAVSREQRPLLEVRDLKVYFPVTRGFLIQRTVGAVKAVDGVSFSINSSETLGLVGESGSGKTTIGRAITQLEKPTSGHVVFEGKDLLRLPPAEMRGVRRRFGIIFQDPYGALNPRMTAGDIIGEPLLAHRVHESKTEYRARVEQLMEVVGLNRAMASRYPHEFSGGQRQRIGIARAISANPSFVVADEPVSALDVSVQAQIINLLEDLQDRYGVAYLFIAHDLSVVRQMSHRVAVMYLGKIVELATREELYSNPLHPYTKALLSAVPIPDPRVERLRERIVLKGDIPSPLNPPRGCVFSSRCPIATDECRVAMPETRELAPGHFVACYKA